jgi:hypothetical protein
LDAVDEELVPNVHFIDTYTAVKTKEWVLRLMEQQVWLFTIIHVEKAQQH